MEVWIGTSGYSYPDWVGSFYPPGIRPQRMLSYYCQHFPLTELNFTFYRPPTAAMLGRIAEPTPAGFQFLVKVPRVLSHECNPRELPGFRLAVEELRRRERLLGLLCQLPQSRHRDRRNCDWLTNLARELADLSLSIEFRHRSWANPEVVDWLRDLHVNLVSVDVPELPALFPRGLVRSGAEVYVRFHSRSAANWYLSDKDRYDYDYREKELTEWIEALAAPAEQVSRVFMLFNNCHRAQAAASAQRMREMLARLEPTWTVVEPFAPARSNPEQRSLFD